MTYEQEQLIKGLEVWGAVGILYLLRNTHPILNTIWSVVKLSLTILLVIITFNLVLGKLKGWFSK